MLYRFIIQVALLTVIFFVGTECEKKRAVRAKNSTQTRESSADLKDILDSTAKRKSVHEKPIMRHKHQSYKETTKFPKLLRANTKKSVERITKMHKLREGNKTTVINLYEPDEDALLKDLLSAYSIKQQLESISKGIPDANITINVVGRTKEYLDIVLLKISKDTATYLRTNDKKYADEKPEKKIVFIVHGLNVMGIRSLRCLSQASSFLTLLSYYIPYLDQFDIFLIPMANPDGYSIAIPNIIWNKNVAPQSECAGVALDRNFDVAWKTINSTISSCSQEYPGPKPFSEPESRVIRDIFYKYSHKIIAYFNVHAGTYGSDTFKGDAVLYPKGYTDSITDEDKFIDLKGEIDEAIRNASFQVYSVAVETLYNWYGKIAGSSVDYASTVYGIPFSLELVMQIYNDENLSELSETFSENALKEVWSRVIDVIFKSISRSQSKENEVWASK